MKIAVLTTQTAHHAYFVRELDRLFPIARVFCETQIPKAAFDTEHPFELERDKAEANMWFHGSVSPLSKLVETQEVDTMNCETSVTALAQLNPNVVIVFGTGLLRPPVLAVNPHCFYNLHGGDPEEYRGLDSHLWAIYHRDFSSLVTTLHRLTPSLDGGNIISKAKVPLQANMPLHDLRRKNTEACLSLTKAALVALERNGEVPDWPQRRVGRYYSYMPRVLKETCVQRFENFSRGLTVC